MRRTVHPICHHMRFGIAAFLLLINVGHPVLAADYFLTIAGGYKPSGNQASLEANVVFFQNVLKERHRGSRTHEIYFADGHDSGADLQILAAKKTLTDRPATDLLASLHRPRGFEHVEYRNHQVPDVSGSLDPELVRKSLEAFGRNAGKNDRLIIYVTAHGSPGPDGQEYNTTIDCWNDKKIPALVFEKWLDQLPSEVPVVMVMAQCYCGGFARTIFNNLDRSNGLSDQIRVGFFAQQHNLPAAGCRPDIEHDEEFSSYFWGALTGRTRNGVPVEGSDIDGNGAVSFAEAYAHAVIAGETIDVPLRATDVFLRTYSRMPESDSPTAADSPNTKSREDANLSAMSGTLQSFVDRARPVPARIVTSLSRTLGFSLTDDVEKVLTAYDEHRSRAPVRGRGRGGRRGNGSGRRDLMQEIKQKWPDLADERIWEDSPLLKLENQQALLDELKQLPSWNAFEERRKQIEESGDQFARHELRDVKFRRLVKALELIVLEKNLPLVATPEIVNRFQQMMKLEESNLTP